jgi:photosystem II stability/assembly factor-like uncharacterized protein
VNWTNVGLNFPGDLAFTEAPLVLDATTYLMGIQDCGAGTCGIYRTTNQGQDWTESSDTGVSHYGAPLWASDGSIYWPLWGDTGLAKSTDLGVTWTKVIDAGQAYGVTPLELPDHSIVTLGKDHVLRSTDGGAEWTPIGEPVPFSTPSSTLAYAVASKTFFLSNPDCGDVPFSNAIMKAGFDYAGN